MTERAEMTKTLVISKNFSKIRTKFDQDSLWSFARWSFEKQSLTILSRRGPRSPDMRLSQHYIGPKLTFCHFLNFCRKKFLGLTKSSCTFLYSFGVVTCKNYVAKSLDSFKKTGQFHVLNVWQGCNHRGERCDRGRT